MPYANNKDTDQPVHPCSLISVFIVRFQGISKFSRLARFGCGAGWFESEDRFSCDLAHLRIRIAIFLFMFEVFGFLQYLLFS